MRWLDKTSINYAHVMDVDFLNDNDYHLKMYKSEQHTSVKNMVASGGAGVVASAGRVVTSDDLFLGSKELMISHAGEVYRLRLTSQGKLILTK